MFSFLAIVIAALLGCIPAAIAQKKGRSFGGWWLFGALLFIIALPMALVASPNPKTMKCCTACMGWVPIDARKCGHCGNDLSAPRSVYAAHTDWTARMIWVLASIVIFLLVVGWVAGASHS